MNLHYFFTFVVIAISGNPAAQIFGKDGTYIAVVLCLLFLWIRKPVKIESAAMTLPFVVFGLTLVHFFSFGSVVVMAGLGFIIKIGIGILAVMVIDGFYHKFVRIMAMLACVSLVFFLPSLIGIDLSGPLSFLNVSIQSSDGFSNVRHIGIHNFHLAEHTDRNSGMFWEPGAFAGYIVLALFVAIRLKGTVYISRWEIIALVAALVSTQSTMGFIAGLVVAIYYFVDRFSVANKASFLVMPLVIVLGGVATYMAVTQLDFLGDKIEEQILYTKVGKGNHEINRFGNMLYDFEFIEARPLAGWSGTPETRFSLDPELAEFISGQGSALTGFWVRFGAIGWFALFWGVYAGSANKQKGVVSGVFLILIILTLLASEQYTNFPMIYTFLVGIGSGLQKRSVKMSKNYQGKCCRMAES